MIFLLDYDRERGSLVRITQYGDDQMFEAQEARLKLEIELNRAKTSREIVLFEAASEEALRRTHRRYFEDLSELTDVSK